MKKTLSGPIALALCQGLFTAALSVDLTLTGLTGYQLAPSKDLALLPFALITLAGACTTHSASVLMQAIGRRWGFILGSAVGAAGGLLSTWAVLHSRFWLFCAGTSAVGIFQAFAQYYRLAAADGAAPSKKASAISAVLTGSVIAAVVGPLLANYSKTFLHQLFAGSYLLVAALSLLSTAILVFVYRNPTPHEHQQDNDQRPPRPISLVLRQPLSVAAIANNSIGGAAMMLVMTATPLAAVSRGYSIGDGANIIEWHLVGMYAPSLIAGRLIRSIGLAKTVIIGCGLSFFCCIISVSSSSLYAFYAALLCLGVGWNFMFVGGSALLTLSHLPSERGRVQGVSEAIRYALTSIATLCAGPILIQYGWIWINISIVPLLGIALIMTIYWLRSEARVSKTQKPSAS